MAQAIHNPATFTLTMSVEQFCLILSAMRAVAHLTEADSHDLDSFFEQDDDGHGGYEGIEIHDALKDLETELDPDPSDEQ